MTKSVSLSSAVATSGTRLAAAQVVAAINKVHGAESIRLLGANDRSNVQALSSGNVAIDIATGIGGLPVGRICEVYGPESSGKTTFCLTVVAQAQRKGGRAAFIDVEHALDPNFARIVGVNMDDLLVSQPDDGETALQITESLIRLNAVDVIVVDSVAALVSRTELDGEMGDATVGVQARLMSQAMRRLTAVVSKTNTILIFTNQIREKIGVMFGNPETTPGGRALKFFASMRIDVRRKDAIKNDAGRTIGFRTKLKFVKNKVAPPFTEVEADLRFDEGFSPSAALVDVGLSLNILEKRGAWLSFNGDLIGQGRDAACQALREKPKLADAIAAAIRVKTEKASGEAAPVEPDPSVIAAAQATLGSDSLVTEGGELKIPDAAAA